MFEPLSLKMEKLHLEKEKSNANKSLIFTRETKTVSLGASQRANQSFPTESKRPSLLS